MSAQRPTGPPKNPTPYGGFVGAVPAEAGCHMLVSGPTGSGKSRRVLGPAILSWRGPVVAVSSKPDLYALCAQQRLAWGGANRTFVLDLSGDLPEVPEGVHKVVVDPTALITCDDDALDLAGVLLQTGSAGAGGGGKGGDSFWESLATAPLAALLRASKGRGMDWLRQAVSKVDAPEDEPDDEFDAPCWANAVAMLEHASPLLAAKLDAAALLDGKMRDSVMITMESCLSPWLRSSVLGSEDDVVFQPDLLSSPTSTLFVIAPAKGVAAGAAVACLVMLVQRWRRNQTEARKLPYLLFVIDEFTNTAPVPYAEFSSWITEARAMRVAAVVALQTTKQLARRYGQEGMEELRSVFPSTMLLVGAAEKEMVEHAAWWGGQTERQKTTIDHQGRQSQQSEKTDTLSAQELLPRSMDEGRLLRGKRPGTRDGVISETGLLVDLPDISNIPFQDPRGVA